MRRALAFAAVSFLAFWLGTVQSAEPSWLLRVARKNVDDLAVLRSAGIPVVTEMSACLFVLGDASDLAALGARGYDVKLLDVDAASADYAIVGLRPDSDVAAVRAAGFVLLAEENWVLLRIPAGSRLPMAADAKVFVGRMSKLPAGLAEPASEPESASTLLVANPIVQKIVAGVADADIDAYWQALVSNAPTGTRFSTVQGCRDAATYCYNVYTALKVPVQYQSWDAGNAPNVIGTLVGATRPGDVYIVEAHLDDLPSSGPAPGADDNASGSAAVLAAAKAISCWGVRNTVKFLNVTGEEAGLFGSDAYAADAAARGENIRAVINHDMIGWAGDGLPAAENLDLNYNAPSQWLAQRFVDAAANYGTGLSVNPILCPSLTVSDHYPFWQRGWSAVCGITDNEGYCGAVGNYPAYHTADDTIAANGNPAFFYKVVKTTVATLAEMADPFKITFGATAYACGASFQVVLADRDLDTASGTIQSVDVHVWSGSEPAGETLTLTERGTSSALFDGSMPTTTAPAVTGDGFLSVAAGDTLNADYLDVLDCDGASNVSYSATAATDCVAPVIAAVASSAITGSSASITWTTNEAATSVVHYGTTPPGPLTASAASLVTAHALPLSGLSECTNYSYWVESADGTGNTASDDAGGAYYAFTTGKNTTPNYTSTGAPVAIPDNDPIGITSTINVSDDQLVQDVNVKVNVAHTYDGDLTITLTPPAGAPITLSNRRGANGDNFADTVFDDQATTSIASGTAPFAGSFQPDTPLATANGIQSLGAWRLNIVDGAIADVGSLLNWTLTPTYSSAHCGPHAAVQSDSVVSDACSIVGPGSGDGYWDPGEQVHFNVRLANDGTVALTGVTATVSATTPGVIVTDGVASYPGLGIGASGNALTPYFSAQLPEGLPCGSLVAFDVTINTTQGSWAGSFTHSVGATESGSATALDEHFAAGIPASWSIVNGGSGGGSAATWTTANPGSRSFQSPLVVPVAIVDSDFAGTDAAQDEQLLTPVMNLQTATTVTLQFDQFFRWYGGGQDELGDVDVRSSLTGGSWVNVFRNQGAPSPDPDHRTLDITAQAAGAPDAQVRFHYYQAAFEWYWQVDNVKVTYTLPSGCQMHTCLATPGPPAVPDGSFGTPMRSRRLNGSGSSIGLTWDVSLCTGADYKVLYGPLASLASYTLSGASCSLGTSGSATWSGAPAGNLWYVVVATDDSNTEGNWCSASSGPCGGNTPSNRCGDTHRNNAGLCQ